MPSPPVLQPPRILSFQQLCIEADPDFWDDLMQPVQYEFGDSVWYHPIPYYDDYQLRLDDPLQGVLDGNQLG